MPYSEKELVTLRIPQMGFRWTVDYRKLAVYAAGKHNFTIRVPYINEDFSETDAFQFDGFLLVFKQQNAISIIDSASHGSITAYELDGCLQRKHVPFLEHYLNTVGESPREEILGLVSVVR